MKLLVTADFHFRKHWFRWVTANAGRYDAVISAGDLLDIFGAAAQTKQVRWVTDWVKALASPLIVAGGNHDVESQEPPVSAGHWLDRLAGAKKFSGSGRFEYSSQPFVRINWGDPIPRLQAGDIVVSHSGPAGCSTSTTKGGGVDNGDLNLADTLRSAVEAPWLALSGHVHDPMCWKDRCGGTITLNPGMSADAAVPNYITVNTATRKACWFRNAELEDAAEL